LRGESALREIPVGQRRLRLWRAIARSSSSRPRHQIGVAETRGALREVPRRRMLAPMRLAEGLVLLLAAVSGVALAASGQLTPSGQVVAADPAAPVPPAMTVVIDPGHGGDDRGAVGPAGLEEKRLTLSVAQRVKALGADRGVRVLLTREDDRQIPLMQRAAFANGAGASLFISLHANASPSPLTTGAEVGSISLANRPAPLPATAATEDRSLLVPLAGSGTRRVVLVAWEQAQVRHADVAAGFAQEIGTRLERVAPLGPRRVYQAPLRPLMGVNLPAALVDLGYVSNRDEEKIAAAEARQAALAQALLDALLGFDPASGVKPPMTR
jgi:N-acetylmuramoyl-L-alanine amidase